VKPPRFDYHAPTTVDEAVALLGRYGGDAKVLAGGQSLVPLMNFRLARPSYLVDINGLDALAGVARLNGRITIGAMTRQRDAASHEQVIAQLPILAEAISFIGHPAIQNRGTVGGSFAHADPAAELPVVALALDAQLNLQRLQDTRTVDADKFTLGYLSTVLEPDELLMAVSFAVPTDGSGWCFTEVARRHGDFALVAVAALLTLDDAGAIASARLALGGVGAAPVRARAAERVLVGQPATDEAFRAAAAAADDVLDPEDDLHASAAYRRHLASVLIRRALTVAASRAVAPVYA
jgi:aerobic carbon-monoxide dehydrogenase medium subunit